MSVKPGRRQYLFANQDLFKLFLPVTFRAAADAKFPMIIGILSMFFCRIALAYLLSIYFNMGMFGTWVAMFIDWIVKAIIFVYRYLSGKWMEFHAI